MSGSSRRRLADLLAQREPDLAEANLLIAVEAYPDLDLDAELGRVDDLAADARARGGTVIDVAAALREAGLRGDREDYDDPRNSFLNAVLDRGRGLPIALSALTVAVGARVGARMAGVGMPGHFIVADLAGGPRYLDPFEGWAVLSRADCARRVRETAGVEFREEHLSPATPREVVLRMLANLRGSYLRRRRMPDALWTVDLSLIAAPDAEPLVRERGVLLAAVGRYAEAEEEALDYLARRPDDPHRPDVERHLEAVRDMRRRMN